MKYTVKSPLRMGGKRHEVGAVVELDEASGARLAARGRVEPVRAAKVEPEPKDPKAK